MIRANNFVAMVLSKHYIQLQQNVVVKKYIAPLMHSAVMAQRLQMDETVECVETSVSTPQVKHVV
jgi:hypothetical protein